MINTTSFVGKSFNFGYGLSDVHNLIGAQIKLGLPLCKLNRRTYISFRNCEVENFNHELNDRLGVSNFSENRDVNGRYETFTNTFSQVTDKYAPLKKKNMSFKTCAIYE